MDKKIFDIFKDDKYDDLINVSYDIAVNSGIISFQSDYTSAITKKYKDTFNFLVDENGHLFGEKKEDGYKVRIILT